MSVLAPVIFFIFNRPELTKQVWEAITRAKPKKLYICADGPRKDKPDDIEKIRATRQCVERVDWPCEIHRWYANENLGCNQSFVKNLDQLFEVEDRVIVLEDDTLPSESFFPFCDVLLEKYKDESTIFHITGSNLNWDLLRPASDYYFSRYALPWGWATWKRAWRLYDSNMQGWKNIEIKEAVLNSFKNQVEKVFWNNIFDNAYRKIGDADAYDYVWKFSIWAHDGLSIIPSVNLVKNIGFGENSTHTKNINPSHIVPLRNLNLISLKHPKNQVPNGIRDARTFRIYCLYEEARPWKRLYNFLKIKGGYWKKRCTALLFKK